MSWIIDFQPLGRRIDIQNGQSLLEAARQLVLPDDKTVYAPCGGVGSCGRCRVRIVRGPVTPPTDSEKRIPEDQRLIHDFLIQLNGIRALYRLIISLPRIDTPIQKAA